MEVERGICEFCGNPVTGLHTAAFRIRGWEVERQDGGANRILGRERQPNRIVHAWCAEDDVKGLPRDSLFSWPPRMSPPNHRSA